MKALNKKRKKKSTELVVEPEKEQIIEPSSINKKPEAELTPAQIPKKSIEAVDDLPPWDTSNTDSSSNSEAPLETTAKPSKNIPWHDVVPQLKLGGRAAELIKHCLLESKEGAIINLLLDKSSEGLLAESVKQEIESALIRFYGDNTQLIMKVAEAKIAESGSENLENETPAQRNTRLIAEKQQQAEQNIANDPFVIELQSRFGAQIVPGSVQPKD